MAGKNWEDFIQPCSLDGIVFDCISTKDSHSHDWDEQLFPGRPGGFQEDRARRPTTFELLCVFVDDDYPDTMLRLIASIDAGGVKEFVHPIFGSYLVAVKKGDVDHNAEEAFDSATMQLSLSEHVDATKGPTVDPSTLGALASNVRSSADGVTASAQALAAALPPGAPPDQVQATMDAQTAAAAAHATADSFEDDGDTLTLGELQSETSGSLSFISSTINPISDFSIPEMYSLAIALSELAQALSLLGGKLIAAKPPLVEKVVPYGLSLRALAFELYADGDRADELLALNSIADPLLLVAGMRYVAYAS